MNTTRRQLLAQRAENMRNQMTYPERRLWFSFLREYPTPFVAQKVIGSYIVDFYCRKARLSIELDGDSHYTESQTGHLIFSTLHTIGAASTIVCIIDVFPPNQQHQIAIFAVWGC